MKNFFVIAPFAATFLFGTAAVAQTPARVANVIGRVGMNTHIPENNYGYQTYSQVESNLEYLGLPIMRDSAEATIDVTNISTVANAAGVKVDDYIGENSPAGMAVDLSLMPNFAPGLLMAIEGGDEEDDGYPVGLGNSLSITAAFQQRSVWPMGRQLGLPVIGMSFGSGYTSDNAYIGDYGMVGDLSVWTNHSTAHAYPQLGQTPAFSMGDVNGLAHMSGLSVPVAMTELGWEDTVFTQAAIAQNAVAAVLDAQLFGNSYLMFYALYDDGSGNWGFFSAAGATRPAAVAIHNLTTILADTGATAKSFTQSALGYTLVGQQTGDSVVVMENSTGGYYVAIWNENEAVTHTVKVLFSGTVPTVSIYDPTVQATPTSTASSATSATLTVQTYPTFVGTSAGANLPALLPTALGVLLTPPTAIGTATSTANPLGAIPLSDAAEQGVTGNLTIHLTATGTFTVSSAQGTVTGSGTASLTDTVTWAQIAHDLSSIVYTSPASGTADQVVMTITDQASNVTVFTVPVTIPQPYNYPVLVVPTTLAAVTNVQMALTPINITDYQALIVPTAQVINVRDYYGLLQVPVSQCGGTVVSGNNTATLSLSGTTNQLNQCIQYLTYQAANNTTSDIVVVKYISQFGQTATASAAVTVSN